MFNVKFFLRYYFPKDFFERVSNSKDISISEKIARAILSNVFDIPMDQISRGDDSLRQPDFIIENQGYEVTFACRDKIQSFKKGDKIFDFYNNEDIRATLDIAISKKAEKNYSIPTNLVLFLLEPYVELYEPFDIYFQSEVINEKEGKKVYVNSFSMKSPIYKIYKEIYETYINTDKGFKNIFIIMIDIDSQYKFINIKNLIRENNCGMSIKTIARKNSSLPYYEVIRVDEESGGIF